MTKIINCGSLNIDHVYKVPHIVRPGETISSDAYELHCGGKGANQSVALARAGAPVRHVGKIGTDGQLLLEKLKESEVDTAFVTVGEDPSGHAIIQVAESGENSIVLFSGANRKITEDEVATAFYDVEEGDILLLQNETNINEVAINEAVKRGMKICFNPAPFDDSVRKLPLDKVNILIVNESEGEGLSGTSDPYLAITELSRKWLGMEIVMTLGKKGVLYSFGGNIIEVPGHEVNAVDTTAAGDTFIGYFLAGKMRGLAPSECLELGCKAAAICVTRRGAMDSIPYMKDLGKQ